VTVGLVTDSAASLPAALVERWSISVVPQHLVLAGEDHPDGALPLEEVLARSHDGVSTSAPSPGEFLALLEPLATEGAVVVTVASEMSGTYKSAWLAATTLDGRVRVVDSRTAAGAEGLVVLAAARAAAAGATLDEVEGVANDVAGRTRLIATLPGLEHLVRSGRVPGLAGWAGRVLGLQPLFAFSHGRARPLRPSQSREAALDRVVARCLEDGRDGALHLAAMHACARDEALALVDRVRAQVSPATSFVAEFSPVMVAHTGPGLVGLGWWWERDPGGGYGRAPGARRSRSSSRRHR
jgi:DegV family protein with EDD domain